MRPDFGKVAHNRDVQSAIACGLEVQEVERPKLLVDDGVGRGGSGFDVQAIVLHDLLHLLRLDVVSEEGHRAIAVREEINGVADPHGIEVVGIFAGNHGFNAGIRKIRDPDRFGLSATIALPGILPVNVRHIGDARSVRRERRFRSSRQGHLRCETAFQRNAKELHHARGKCCSRGTKHDLLSVRCPALNTVVLRVIRQPARHTPSGRHHVDSTRAVVIAREGDLRAIGEKSGLPS